MRSARFAVRVSAGALLTAGLAAQLQAQQVSTQTPAEAAQPAGSTLPPPPPASNAIPASPGAATAAAVGGDTAAPAQQGLDDIVVTARRVEENLQNVPIAVTAYSGVALQQQSVQTVPDVANLTPGLRLTTAQTSQGAVLIQMRGQVQQDTLATLDPSVGTYVDGVYWARAYGLNATLVDVSSFQALKGPQGTLFGRNTSGGAILINTNDPRFSDGFSGQVSATLGRFDYRSLTAVANLPIIDEKLAARFVFSGNKRDGYSRDVGSGRRIQNLNNYTFRGKVLVAPVDGFTLLLAGEKFHSKTNDDPWHLGYFAPGGLASQEAGLELLGAGQCFANPAACFAAGDAVLQQTQDLGRSPRRTWLTAVPKTTIDTETFSATGTVETGFGAVKAIVAYRNVDARTFNLENDGAPTQILDGAGLEAEQQIDQWSGEITATGRALADRLDFAAGLFGFIEDGSDGTPSSTLTAFGRLQTGVRAITIQNGDIKTKSWGVFGQGTYRLTDRLSLTAGLRYSEDKKSLSSFAGTFLGETFDDPNGILLCSFASGCPNSRSATFESWSYTASIDYKPSDRVLVYLKTAKGFRAGGFSLRGSEAAPRTLLPFRPEIVFNYEVGLKSQFFDNRVRTNLSAFYSKTKDVQRNIQLLAPNGQVVTGTENAAKVDIWGAELDASVLLGAGFRVDGTAAYTRPKYKSFIDPSGFDRSREPFPLTPRWTASLSPTWEGEANFGKISARVDFSYQSKVALFAQGFYTDAAGVTRDATNGTVISAVDAAGFTEANTGRQDILINARAGVTVLDGTLDLSVWGRNLSNRRDRTSALVIPALGSASVRLREPRTYGVTATARF